MSTRKLVSTRSAEHQDIFARVNAQPLVTASHIKPSAPDLETVAAVNPAFLMTEHGRHLVVRVDERPSTRVFPSVEGEVLIPYVSRPDSQVQVQRVRVPASFDPTKEPLLPDSDQPFFPGTAHRPLLTYISHLRVVQLEGSINAANYPIAFPQVDQNQYGIQDPRATRLGDGIYLTYTGFGACGATSWIAAVQGSNPVLLNDPSVVFGPDHKHTVLFPEKIGAYYYALSRPLARTYIRDSGIWLFRSPDLLHWGAPTPVLLPRAHSWDCVRVGPGTPPLRTADGWLVFYYGVDAHDSYHAGVALLDHRDPSRVLGQGKSPVLSPTMDWERMGRRADTVFPCGAEECDNGVVRLYYGAADTCIGAAEAPKSLLMQMAKGMEASR